MKNKINEIFVICLRSKDKIRGSIVNYLDLFINTSSNYISIRSRLVNQPKNKLTLNSEQLFNATDLLPITFGTILFLFIHKIDKFSI